MFNPTGNTSLFSGGPNAFSNQQAGTVIKFNPVEGTDIRSINGEEEWHNTKHQSITCMKEYENKSFEELRFEDYQANRKGPHRISWLPTQPPINFFEQNKTNKLVFGQSTFGQTTGPFGQNKTAGFGLGTQQNTTCSLFAKPTDFSSQTSSTGFGFPATSAQNANPFGTSTAQKTFGTGTTQPLFGTGIFQSNTSGFGTGLFSNTKVLPLMAEMFEKLKCSKCKKYLSVLPIKVYHNRLVTCGRCNSENDGGTISTLYESIAQNIEFPCANHFEGCRRHQLPKDMILHENTCQSSLVSCPLCDFEGYSLVLVDHVKLVHTNFFLDIPLFYISFNASNKEEQYVYASASNYTLVIIRSRYDSVVNSLHLNFNLICLENELEKTLKFNLYSIDNKPMYKSVENKFVPNNVGSRCCSYQIFTASYRVDKAICRFFIESDIKLDLRINSCDSLPKHPIKKCMNSSNSLSDASSEKLLTNSKIVPNTITKEVPTPSEFGFTFGSVVSDSLDH